MKKIPFLKLRFMRYLSYNVKKFKKQ